MNTAKHIFTFVLLTLLSLRGIAQITKTEKLFFDADWEPCTEETAAYYRLIKPLSDGLYDIKDFYMSGVMQFETTSSIKEEPFHREGFTAFYSEQGDTQTCFYMKNNTYHGEFVQFYSNGRRKSLITMVDGKQEGRMETYFPWGGIQQSFTMRNGRADGEALKYGIQGHLKNQRYFENGLQKNREERYYDNGQLKSKVDMNDHYTNGSVERYHENGRLRIKYVVNDNVVNDWIHEYDTSGNKLVSAHFQNKKVVEYTQTFQDLGSTFKKTMKREGDVEFWKVYRDDVLVLEGSYDDEERSAYKRTWIMYSVGGEDTLMVMTYTDESCLPEIGDMYSPRSELRALDNILNPGWSFVISSGMCLPETRYPSTTDQSVIRMNNPFKLDLSKDGFDLSSLFKPGSKVIPTGEGKGYISNELEKTIAYTDPSTREPFALKNKTSTKTINGQTFTYAERNFGALKVYFYASQDIDALKALQASITPESGVIHFFYQQFENKNYPKGYRPPRRYMRFHVTQSMIEALNAEVVQDYDLLDLIENKIFFTSDFSGGTAMDELEERMEKAKQ